jgi:glycosyltransferase involved in cell wall biosynthesis
MTLTEAAACGTPSVATRIPGHEDAVVHDVSGLLVDREDDLAEALRRVLVDDDLRGRLGAGALARGRALTWERTAYETLAVLAATVRPA